MNTRRLVPAADCLILSQVCGGPRNVQPFSCVGTHVGRSSAHGGDGVEGRVGADAEVRAGDVVGDSSGDDHHWNAHLFVLLSGLDQLQTSHVGLQSVGEEEGELWWGAGWRSPR